jgi:hypothetical protein
MAVETAILREFLRKVYRTCDEQDLQRSDYLDGLADVAIDALNKGKSISSSSGNGTSVSYELFYGWNPDKLLQIIDRSRDNIAAATITLALADVTAIRHVSTNFNNIHK